MTVEWYRGLCNQAVDYDAEGRAVWNDEAPSDEKPAQRWSERERKIRERDDMDDDDRWFVGDGAYWEIAETLEEAVAIQNGLRTDPVVLVDGTVCTAYMGIARCDWRNVDGEAIGWAPDWDTAE